MMTIVIKHRFNFESDIVLGSKLDRQKVSTFHY